MRCENYFQSNVIDFANYDRHCNQRCCCLLIAEFAKSRSKARAIHNLINVAFGGVAVYDQQCQIWGRTTTSLSAIGNLLSTSS